MVNSHINHINLPATVDQSRRDDSCYLSELIKITINLVRVVQLTAWCIDYLMLDREERETNVSQKQQHISNKK